MPGADPKGAGLLDFSLTFDKSELFRSLIPTSSAATHQEHLSTRTRRCCTATNRKPLPASFNSRPDVRGPDRVVPPLVVDVQRKVVLVHDAHGDLLRFHRREVVASAAVAVAVAFAFAFVAACVRVRTKEEEVQREIKNKGRNDSDSDNATTQRTQSTHPSGYQGSLPHTE